jgi:hypothetical protein
MKIRMKMRMKMRMRNRRPEACRSMGRGRSRWKRKAGEREKYIAAKGTRWYWEMFSF